MTHSFYRRLTRKNRTWTGFSQAWLGDDHLLIVNSMRMVERYQRFAFSDIQAIVVSEGGRRMFWQPILLLVCVLGGVTVRTNLGRGFFSVVGVVALGLVILDIARGPRCACVLQTAVSRERLWPISRMRAAGAFLAAITPAIEAAQGHVSAEELAAEAARMPQPAVVARPPAVERPLGYTQEVFFGLLLLDSVLVFVALRSTIGIAFGLLPTIYVAEFLIGIVALIQAGRRSTPSLAVLVAAFLCIILDPFILSGTAAWPALVAVFQQAPSGTLPWNMQIAAPGRTLLLAAGWRAAMASAGLAISYFDRQARAH